jgi:hypothetical protein
VHPSTSRPDVHAAATRSSARVRFALILLLSLAFSLSLPLPLPLPLPFSLFSLSLSLTARLLLLLAAALSLRTAALSLRSFALGAVATRVVRLPLVFTATLVLALTLHVALVSLFLRVALILGHVFLLDESSLVEISPSRTKHPMCLCGTRTDPRRGERFVVLACDGARASARTERDRARAARLDHDVDR